MKEEVYVNKEFFDYADKTQEEWLAISSECDKVTTVLKQTVLLIQ